MNDQDILQHALDATQSLAALQLESLEWSAAPWGDAVARLVLSSGDSEEFAVEVKRNVERLETLRLLHEHAQENSRRRECQNFCVRGTLNLHGSREAG